MTLKVELAASVKVITTAAPDGGASKADQLFSHLATLLDGVTNDKANLAFLDSRTLASNTAETLDLAGSLTDALGNPVVFAEVCAVYIKSAAANTTDLTIGGATAEWQAWFTAAGDKEVLSPGAVSFKHKPAGWAVTATTADGLKIANASGAAATYDIAIIGRNA